MIDARRQNGGWTAGRPKSELKYIMIDNVSCLEASKTAIQPDRSIQTKNEGQENLLDGWPGSAPPYSYFHQN